MKLRERLGEGGRAMNTNIEVLRELDELVEAARLLGGTQAKRGFGCHTDEDRRFERAMYESIDKHRAALLNWGAKQPVPQQPAAGDGCHCGTCTCEPNMTPAVRFALSPAQQEGAIREHLIQLSWTPPGAQQPAAEQDCDNCGGFGDVSGEYPGDACPDCRGTGKVPAQQSAAPVLAKYQPCGCVICTCEDEQQCQGCGAKHCGNRTDHPLYVVQQPAAVDEAMVEEANERMAIAAYENYMGVSADDPAYGPDLSQWMAGWTAALAAQQPAAVNEPCAAVAAIQFALTDPEGMTFLRLWNEGEFDTLRREWPDAPRKVYDGADPLA